MNSHILALLSAVAFACLFSVLSFAHGRDLDGSAATITASRAAITATVAQWPGRRSIHSRKCLPR